MPKANETILEINLKALKHNFDYISSKINNNTKLMAVVKAFGYGSDAIVVAKHLQELKADYLAVAYVSEGVALRNAGITIPILVLHPQPINFKTLIKHRLEPSLYNAKVLNEFVKISAGENLTNYPIHIKFNTGLNRLGFWENDIDYVVSKLHETNTVKVISVFSHLAASEDLNEKAFTLNQIASFKAIYKKIIDRLNYKPLLHICNTSGILNYPEAHFDMVRCGIGLYGFGNSSTENQNFKPIASLKSVISQIHLIEKGETVGYNRAFQCESFQKTATIPIGHADGIGRQYGNGKGFVTIKGQRAPIVGNVCMDMIMVNVTNIDCKEGDEVIIFGEHNSAKYFAETTNSISYEIITAISQRVKRIILK